MDLVYLYTAGSDTNEIRYSLRSMKKHLSGIDNVFVVGDDPGILKNVTFLPCENKHRHNGARNIYDKIMTACRHPKLSKNFVTNSDDYFLLKDLNAETIPYYHCGKLADTIHKLSDRNPFKIHVVNTHRILQEKRLPVQNFNIHYPIIYNKETYIDIMSQYDWEINRGYISKSLYANTLLIEGEFLADSKIHTPKTKTAVYRRIKDVPAFSTNEHSMNDPMLEVMQELYPDPSPWEM